jgi:hypothetical protein
MQPMYNVYAQMLFSVLFSAAPIVIYGVTERDIDASVLLTHPHLYAQGSAAVFALAAALVLWRSYSVVVQACKTRCLQSRLLSPGSFQLLCRALYVRVYRLFCAATVVTIPQALSSPTMAAWGLQRMRAGAARDDYAI